VVNIPALTTRSLSRIGAGAGILSLVACRPPPRLTRTNRLIRAADPRCRPARLETCHRGYDKSDTLILNDPGITLGHEYHIKFDQLTFAINDLDQAYPDLNQGQIILVLAPQATS